ncbi:hypothetical protein GCM10027290_40500 [Micromonospora sonneratiae]
MFSGDFEPIPRSVRRVTTPKPNVESDATRDTDVEAGATVDPTNDPASATSDPVTIDANSESAAGRRMPNRRSI